MGADRRLRLSVLAATALLGVATIGLASVPPRPLRSALTVVHALSFRVATDWLVVVGLLALAERYVSPGVRVDRTTVQRLAAAVFLGGLAVEASPFVRLVVEPAPVGTGPLARGVAAAVQRALFPAGLFLGTALGAATLHRTVVGRGPTTTDGTRATSDGATANTDGATAPHSHGLEAGRLPLAPTGGYVPKLSTAALRRAATPLVAVAGVWAALDVGVRFALGDPYPWLVLADALTGALAGLVGHAVLAVAFLVLVVEGVRVRTLVGGTVAVWAALFLSGVLVAVASALLAVGIVGATTTPMAAVEAAALGRWPAPDSWALLLRVGTFLAGAVGLFAVQRAGHRRRRPPRRDRDRDHTTATDGVDG